MFEKGKIGQAAAGIYGFVMCAKKDLRLGLLLLLISLVIGLFTAPYTFYNPWDEGDTNTVGWLISKGNILYRDIFSHHFPLSYFWTSIVSALFGTSIIASRVSLFLLRIVLFFFVMRITRYSFVIGLTSIAWSLIGPMYLGNLLLYYSFDGILVVCGFLVALAMLNKDTEYTIPRAVFAGVLIGCALLSDPLMLFPGMFVILAISISGCRHEEGFKQKAIRAAVPFLAVGLVIFLFLGYLLVTSSLEEFFQSAILFNTQIYSRYSGELFTLPRFLQDAASALNVLDPSLVKYLGPYFVWGDFTSLDQWAFTSLLFRLSIIVASVVMISRRNIIGGLLIYLVGAALFTRGSFAFHSSPFVLFSLVVSAMVLIDFLRRLFSLLAEQRPPRFVKTLARMGILAASLIVCSMVLWLNIRMGEFWVQNFSNLSYEQQFKRHIASGEAIQRYTCGYDGAVLLAYPLHTTMYYFSGLLPASRYLFMTPWVAEIGQQEVISDLSTKAAVVYLNKDFDIAGYPVSAYLGDLIAFLDREYIEVDPYIYISPLIKDYCDLKK